MLGALCDGIRVHDLLKCSSHPACLYVLNNSCFCFLEYLFICDAVCISDLSDFIYTGCWKASICSLPWSHWRRELHRKDHRPQDRTFSKFWHLLQDHTGCILMIPTAVYDSGVCICLHMPMNRTSLLPVIRSCLNKQQISTPTMGAFASWVIIVNSSKLEYIHVLIQQAVLWVSVQSVVLLRDFTSSHCIPKHGLLFS